MNFPGRHFRRDEFACKCKCGFNVIDAELLKVLNRLRETFNTPIKINSGARCAAHNKAVGGSPKSQHLLGKAADITMNRTPQEVFNHLDYIYHDCYGIGLYDTFVHIDVREKKARW